MSFKVSPENALLGILMNGPKHGYEFHGYMSTRMNDFWQLSMSQIYALSKKVGTWGAYYIETRTERYHLLKMVAEEKNHFAGCR